MWEKYLIDNINERRKKKEEETKKVEEEEEKEEERRGCQAGGKQDMGVINIWDQTCCIIKWKK